MLKNVKLTRQLCSATATVANLAFWSQYDFFCQEDDPQTFFGCETILCFCSFMGFADNEKKNNKMTLSLLSNLFKE